MSKRRSSKDLLAAAEKFTLMLLSEATKGQIGVAQKNDGSDVPDMPFGDRRALLDSIVKLLTVKHKVDPKEEESPFANLRERLNGTAGKTAGGTGNGLSTALGQADPDGDPDAGEDEHPS